MATKGRWFVFGLFLLTHSLALSQKPAFAEEFVRFQSPPQEIEPHYLKSKIESFLSKAGEVNLKKLKSHIQDMYLQRGNPNAQIRIHQSVQGVLLDIQENTKQAVTVERLKISGGTPQQRYVTWLNLKDQSGKGLVFNKKILHKEIRWIEKNHFIPLTVVFKSSSPGKIEIKVDILNSQGVIPTANLGVNDVTGLSLTAGAILYDWPENHLFRGMIKRNNLAFNAGITEFKTTNEVQDWEYLLTWSTGQLPLPGVTFGVNHYNKVDYIYPHIEEDKHLWIQSLGADLYSGFPIWSNSTEKQYLRGVLNLSFIKDNVGATEGSKKPALEYTQSGRDHDRLILPSLSLIYSDIDDYVIPRNGSLIRGRVGGGLGDALYGQSTASYLRFWTPWEHKGFQQTFVFNAAGGTTFGNKQPFYRGFLNAGNWLVRGSQAFSITEKHALKMSQEYHWIYRPDRIFFDELAQNVIKQDSKGFFDGWAFDANVFLDEGTYWSDHLNLQAAQASVGVGLNARTPTGTLVGFNIAMPFYSQVGSPQFLLRISAPLAFTLYSDWINSNGFFLR